MNGKSYQQGYHLRRTTRGVKEKPWIHDQLNVLQLDLFDRTVVKIAGKKTLIFIIKPEAAISAYKFDINRS